MSRFLLRRDRIVLTSWIALIAGVVLSVTGQYTRMFPTPESALAFAHDVAGNAALTAFTGQLTDPTLPGLIRWKIADVAFTLTALMAILTVIRHTRAEEESGRANSCAPLPSSPPRPCSGSRRWPSCSVPLVWRGFGCGTSVRRRRRSARTSRSRRSQDRRIPCPRSSR